MAIEHHELDFWLSGGASNTDPTASLGGARSTAQTTVTQTYSLSSALSGLTLLYASGRDDAAGTDAVVTLDTSGPSDRVRLTQYPNSNLQSGSLTGTTGTTTGYSKRRWDPGGLIEDRGVMRVTADWDVLTPSETRNLIVTTPQDELFAPYVEADYTAGATFYRCIYLRNNGSAALGSGFTVEPGLEPDSLSIAFGLDPAGVNGTATTIANEHTAPASVSFSTSALAFPDLAAGDVQALWIRITMAALFEPPVALEEQVSIILYDEPVAYFMPWASTFEAPAFDPEEDVPADSINFTDEGGGEPVVSLVTGEVIVGPETRPVDEIAFTDVVDAIDPNVILDGLEFEDEATAILITTQDPDAETITFTDEATATRLPAPADVTDEIAFEDELSSSGIFSADVTDLITFDDFVRALGQLLQGWTLNVETDAASRYVWSAFNSFTEFEGRYYGAADDGLHELTGDTDAGVEIEAFILTGVGDHGVPQEKRVTRAYVGIRANGSMMLKTVSDEDDIAVYDLVSTGGDLAAVRVKLSQGKESVYWQYALQNVDGADFELESVKVLPIVLSRRFD